MSYCRKSLSSLSQLICLAILVFTCQSIMANSHDKLPLNGIASYQMLGSEYYIASLYLQNPTTNEGDILNATGLQRMKLVVTRDKWRSRHFADAWLTAININNDKKTQKALGKSIYSFTQIAPKALRNGDQITIDHTPGKGTQVRINDSLVLKVNDDKYFAVLLRAWIGQRPPSTDFKEHIINKNSNPESKDLILRTEQTQPKNKTARYAEVASWSSVISASALTRKKSTATKTSSVDITAKVAEQKRKAKQEAAKKAKRKAEAVKKAELKRQADAAKKAELKRQADAAKKAKEQAEAIKRAEAEQKRLEQAKIAEEKRLEAERKKKRGNPLRNRLRAQMYKNVYNAFNQNINRIAQERVIYPTKSLNEKQQGNVTLNITLERNGQLQQSELISKTPHIALNKAAEKAVKSATFPPLPEQLNDTEDFTVEIKFSLN